MHICQVNISTANHDYNSQAGICGGALTAGKSDHNGDSSAGLPPTSHNIDDILQNKVHHEITISVQSCHNSQTFDVGLTNRLT